MWARAADLVGPLLGDTLHPGGPEATKDLLDDVGIEPGDRVLDVGCGAGGTSGRVRDRGASVVGLDVAPGRGAIRGRAGRLPFRDASFDAVVAECSLCLASDLDVALDEVGRVLRPGGRLGFSDVTLAAPLDLPGGLARMLCLEDARPAGELRDAVEEAGLRVESWDDREDDLRDLRARAHERLDVDGLLSAIGDEAVRDAVATLEDALDAGTVGYVAVVARQDRSRR